MPPEVISLISSPEYSPVHRHLQPNPSLAPAPPRPTRTTSQRNDLSFLSDDLNSSLYEFANFDTPASKRRRLSPTPEIGRDILGTREREKEKGKDPFSLLLSEDSIVSDTRADNRYEHTSRYNPPPRTNLWSEISDPIICSSSAPEPRHQDENQGSKRKGTRAISVEDSGNDWKAKFFGDFEDETPLRPLSPKPFSANLSSRTAALLASIRDKNAGSKASGAKGRGKSGSGKEKGGMSIVLSDSEDDILDVGPAFAPEKKKKCGTKAVADKSAKASERQAAKARRDQEKAEEKERKRKEKEEKDRQKRLAADIAEVNKSKIDKKVSTPEMIIDVSATLEGTSVGNQVEEFMRHLGVEMKFVSTQQPGIVRWRRKVSARYNEEAGHWEPCPTTIEREGHVLCFLSAQDSVDMATSSDDDDGGITLEGHLLKLKRLFPNCKPIYLIEGLSSWMRKNQNARNRAYQAAVRRQFDNDTENAPRRRTKQPDPPPIDSDTIEDALLTLQVQHNALIQHTSAPAESAEWIKIFTEHISTIPYRRERMTLRDASFCMDVGQVKTGDDAADTYVKMMQEIQRVTAPMAYGVAAEYEDVRALVSAMRGDGPLMLQDVKKCTNKSGGVSEARIGPAVSRRLFKVFTGLDPGSTDV